MNKEAGCVYGAERQMISTTTYYDSFHFTDTFTYLIAIEDLL